MDTTKLSNIREINKFLNFQDDQKDIDKGIGSETFGKVLNNSLQHVNKLQIESSEAKKKLALGEIDNLHDLPIINEKANIALQVTMSIRGKVVEAYKEIMRIQI